MSNFKCFSDDKVTDTIERINKLSPTSAPLWGKMTVAKMLKHLCVPYKQIKSKNPKAAPWYLRIMLQLFYKKIMTNETPYAHNMPTAKNFIIKEEPEFEQVKTDLIQHLLDIKALGPEAFEGRKHVALSTLSAKEWDNLLYKHLDHHLRQFGV
jgi:hypothetical protein